jgi:hypothetical protein
MTLLAAAASTIARVLFEMAPFGRPPKGPVFFGATTVRGFVVPLGRPAPGRAPPLGMFEFPCLIFLRFQPRQNSKTFQKREKENSCI